MRDDEAFDVATLRNVTSPLSRSFSLHMVRRCWTLHGEYSGYDPLFRYMSASAPFRVTSSDFRFFQRTLISFPRQTLRLGKSILLGRLRRTYGVLAEAIQRCTWMRSPPDVIHLLAVDELVGPLALLALMRKRFPSTRLVGAIHLPASIWRTLPKSEWQSLENLDLLIALSTEQRDFFQRELPGLTCLFVPHGVDTAFFRPPTAPRPMEKPARVIFVGTFLRDYKALTRCITRLMVLDNTTCFDVVNPRDKQTPELADVCRRFSDRVAVHEGISSHALRDLYQSADVAFIPLRDCVANNAILEALASGLPLVTTDVGGIRDYVSSDCTILVPHDDPDGYAEQLRRLLSDPKGRVRMARAARARAEQFAWEEIVRKTQAAYVTIPSRMQARVH